MFKDITELPDMGQYLSYETVTSICNNVLQEQGSVVDNVMTGAKVLGVAFVVLYWMKEYLAGLKSNDANGKNGISLHAIGRGIVYILVILNLNVISDLCDRGLGAYENSLELQTGDNMYSSSYTEEWMKEDEDALAEEDDEPWYQTAINAVTDFIVPFSDVFYILLMIVKGIAWLVNVLAFPIYLLERGFLLLIMKVTFPLLIALGANEAYRALVRKWILLYCAVFLTGAFFLLATQFCDLVYKGFNEYYGYDFGSWARVVMFCVVAFAKPKLYKGAVEISYKLFNI